MSHDSETSDNQPNLPVINEFNSNQDFEQDDNYSAVNEKRATLANLIEHQLNLGQNTSESHSILKGNESGTFDQFNNFNLINRSGTSTLNAGRRDSGVSGIYNNPVKITNLFNKGLNLSAKESITEKEPSTSKSSKPKVFTSNH